MGLQAKLIGVASGIAGVDQGCEDGPDVVFKKLKEKKIFENIAHSIIKHKNSSENKAEQVHAINMELSKLTYNAIRESQFPIIVGGDHSCAMGSWSGISSACEVNGEMGLIWIDAHMDAHTFETSETKNIHGMPLAALLGKGDKRFTNIRTNRPKLKPQNLYVIGVRSYETAEQQLLQQLGVNVFYMPEVEKRGFRSIFNQAQDFLRKNTVGYGISLDLDGLDPLDAPGVGTPVSNGIKKHELLDTLNFTQLDKHLIGIEIVEFNPYKDVENSTLDIVVEIISLTLKALNKKVTLKNYEYPCV